MRRMLRLLCINSFFLAVISVAHSAKAADATCAQQQTAFVIANGNYPRFDSLVNPVNDAEAISRTLQQLGILVKRGTNLTSIQLKTLITDEVAAMAQAGDSAAKCKPRAVLFFYSGHGVELWGRPYIVATEVDGAVKERTLEGIIGLDEVATELSKASDHIYIFFDASRSNPLKVPAPEKILSTVGLFQSVPEVKAMVFSSQPDQDPVDADPTFDKLSPFARAISSAMDLHWPDVDAVLLRTRDRVSRSTGGRQIPDWYRAPGAFVPTFGSK